MIPEHELPRLHDAALKLLRDVGCIILDPEARTLFKAHGAGVDGARVHLGEQLVADALETAPSDYTVTGRRPALDLHVGPSGEPVFGSGSGPALVLDNEKQMPGTLGDLRKAIALSHVSPNISVHGLLVEPLDVQEERRARVRMHAYVTGSDKANQACVATLADLQVALDVAEILYGSDWHAEPRLWSIATTTSPLQLSIEAGQTVVRLARLGQPVCLTVCAMAGTTAPLTLSGLLALQHAELLVGLVLSQLARPGCPFLYGGTSSMSSMRSGALLMGVPEYWSIAQATVQLGHWLGLPARAGGALTDAHLPDAQAGIESALGLEAALQSRADFVLQAAGILSSFNCFSPCKFVIDDALLSALLLAHRPIVVDDETLALDTTAAAGPGGSFLGQQHTRHHAREASRDVLFGRDSYDSWSKLGSSDLSVRARARVDGLLADYTPPDDLDSVVRRQLDSYCLQ